MGVFTVVSTTFAGHRAGQTTRIPSLRFLALLLTMLTSVLLVDAMIEPIAPFDLWAINLIQRIDLPWLGTIIRPFDALTSSQGAIATWALLLVACIGNRKWLPALAVMMLPVGGLINNFVSEVLVGRTRPHGYDQILRTVSDIEAASFPSGHTMGAVLLYGLIFFLAREFRSDRLRLAVQVGAIAVIGIVGFARVWYGAHWPSDVLGAYALGGLMLVGVIALYLKIEAAVGDIPFIRAATVVHDESRPHAHALTSTVFFNEDGTVSKVYAPGFVPRAIYWLAYQAEFPYIRNRAALEAAVERRNLAGQLTEYWFGSSRVARATGVDTVDGNFALSAEFVSGTRPVDRAQAKLYLGELRRRFEEAGLPTWQIDPRQPRAVDNVIETANGDYMVVDLESGLVSPLASLKTWARAIRRGMVPIYDDVYFDITRAYIERENRKMRESMGEEWLQKLRERVNAAEKKTIEWHSTELRLWSRIVGGLWSGFGVRTWRSRAQIRMAGGQDKALSWMTTSVDTWHEEGRITSKEAAELRAQMDTPMFQAVLPHLGAHLIITVFLRFPFGSLARMAWTGYALGAATVKLLARKIDRREWKHTWDIHSPLVLLLAAIPGFGAFSYLAARPVRSNRLLMRVTLDAVMHKVPWKLYQRSGMRRIIARPVRTACPDQRPESPEPLVQLAPAFAYSGSDPGAVAAGGD
jgi:membrane-associated phospholipid phosphatase